MILQRLAQALRTQDWFLVVIEILIVVVGIFLGLQVDDWTKARRDRADEAQFLEHLHQDVLVAEQLSSRVRDRRLDRLQHLIGAMDVLFERVESNELSDVHCAALGSATYFNINATPLASMTELLGTGRLDILRSKPLRTALIEFAQAREALIAIITQHTISAAGDSTPLLFPELIQLEGRFVASDNEVKAIYRCDLAGMRQSQAFLNQISVNADRYDAYVSDGLSPWSEQLETLHQLIDEEAGITHQ